MTIIFVLLIALAWAAWLLAWARDRYTSGGTGFGPSMSVGSYFAIPTTPEAARRRRRHVLVALAVLSGAAFAGARFVGSLGAISVVCVVAFVLYALAAARVEMVTSRGGPVNAGLPTQRRASFEPITY